jgi:hypothetical protein
MKGEGLRYVALAIVFGISLEAADAPVVSAAIAIVAGWARALPAPTPAFASMIAAAVWPMATLVIVWWLRLPLELGAMKLVGRFERDNLDFGLFKISSALTPLEPSERAAVSHAPNDQKVIKALLEYAGVCEDNAAELKNWIAANQAPTLTVERFLTDTAFAAARRKVYEELKVA